MTSTNADMLAEPMKIWTTSLMGPTEKYRYCPVILYLLFLLFSSPSLNTLITFSFSFFAASAHMKCIYLGLGREAVTGWNSWTNAAFHVRHSSRDVCVWCVRACVCDVCAFWSQRNVTHLCRLRSFDRLKRYYSWINPEWNSYVYSSETTRHVNPDMFPKNNQPFVCFGLNFFRTLL